MHARAEQDKSQHRADAPDIHLKSRRARRRAGRNVTPLGYSQAGQLLRAAGLQEEQRITQGEECVCVCHMHVQHCFPRLKHL